MSLVTIAAIKYQQRAVLEQGFWHRRKHGFVRAVPRVVRNGIAVPRAYASSMLSNTCCTALLLQGAASPT